MKVKIDFKEYNVEEKWKKRLIYQYVSEKSKDLPCFCYSESLSVAGNCRMCLVEVKGSPKLLASCAVPLGDGMEIYTESLRLSKARESILELLLINHPLDCPVCDQGGECDLQELTFKYGSDRGRYYEYEKRAVQDKHAGLFIKTIMTRCIHCTRCVRFFSEITDSNDFGILGRGEKSEITMLNNLLHPLSGNVIDICPVGALTSKPYSFNARPWELTTLESIDFLDTLCSSIRIDISLNKILRVLPINNLGLNEEWITNKTRYFFDILTYQRLYYPCIITKGKIKKINWGLGLKIFLVLFFILFFKGFKLKYENSNFLDLELSCILKKFFNKIGIGSKNNLNDFRSEILFNIPINDFSKFDNVILLGVNLRLDLPLLYSRIKRFNVNISSFGDFNFSIFNKIFNNGSTFFEFIKFLEGRKKNVMVNKFIKGRFNVRLIKSSNLFIKGGNFNKITDKILSQYGFVSNFRLNLSEISSCEFNSHFLNHNTKNSFNIFSGDVLKNVFKFDINLLFGNFFNKNVKNMDLILPITIKQEESVMFMNLVGDIKRTNKIKLLNKLNVKTESNIINISEWYFDRQKFYRFSYFPLRLLKFFCLFNYKIIFEKFLKHNNIKLSVKELIYNSYYLANSNFNLSYINYYQDNLKIYKKSKILYKAGKEESKKRRIFF